MFQQEIINAELRKRYCLAFKLNNLFTLFFPIWLKRCFLPVEYILPEKSGGQLLQDLIGFNDKNIMDGLSDHDLYAFYKKYSRYFSNDSNIITNFINGRSRKRVNDTIDKRLVSDGEKYVNNVSPLKRKSSQNLVIDETSVIFDNDKANNK